MVKNFALAAIVALFATTTFADTKTESATKTEEKVTVTEDAAKPAAAETEAKKDEAKK